MMPDPGNLVLKIQGGKSTESLEMTIGLIPVHFMTFFARRSWVLTAS